jgi:hypothetical protein
MTDLMTEVREALEKSLAWLRDDCRPDAEWAGEGHNWNMSRDDRARGCAVIEALVAIDARLDGITIVPAGEVERLREALERCIDALDTVRDGLAVRSTDAVVLSAEGVLRHAAKKARAALGEEAER